MQPLLVKDIRILLGGELICGLENWKVKDVIYYKRHELTKPCTLLFVNRNDTVNWKEINELGPSLVISDKPTNELNHALSNTTVLRVASLIQSYWKFMKYYRNLFTLPVITITGTCGKTTTKDMIAHILNKDYNVQASISSQNEPRRSLPYLMGIDEKTDVAVFEHGLGNTGNIKHQCMIYQPTIGIITTIGVHHLDGCQNLEGYIRAKAEIVEGLKENGTLILNADDKNTRMISLKSFKGKVIYYGVDKRSNFRASTIKFANNGMEFRLHYGKKTYKAFIAGFGEHQVYNALAALAAVSLTGIDMSYAISRLSTYRNMARHLEFSGGLNDSTIIDDTWTNNPTSIEAALKVLDSIGKGKKIVLVLGDINRLGDFEKKYHREIGTLVANRNIHSLITIGSKAEEIAKQAIRDGSKAAIHICQKVSDIKKIVDPVLDSNTILLIKGPMSSRAMIQFADSLKVDR